MTMSRRSRARFVFALALTLVGLGSLFNLARPAEAQIAPDVAHLAGPWQASLLWSGSGCGAMSGLLRFTLDKNGTANAASLTTHSGCGDGTTTETFVIQSLDAQGSGTANLTCGPACGWNLNIQVARNGQVFNLVDVSPANPGNYVAGTAVRQ
jgi:hypothetical protein